MAFTPKDWRDYPDTTTPVTAAALEDVETRVSGYTDTQTAYSGARVFNSANFSVPNNAWTPITFDSERFDTGAFHSTSANTSRLTAPTTGLYLIGFSASFLSNATGRRGVAITLNAGATFLAAQVANTISGSSVEMAVSTAHLLTAGDFVEAAAYQNSTAALNIQAAINFSPEFWIVRQGR